MSSTHNLNGPGGNSSVSMHNVSAFHPFVESVNRSSERARGAVFLSIVVTLIFLGIVLESANWGWSSSKLNAWSNAKGWIGKSLPANAKPDMAKSYKDAQMLFELAGLDAAPLRQSETGSKRLEDVGKSVDEAIASLSKRGASAQVFKLPLADFAIDLNYLSLLIGIGTLFVGMVVNVALKRELNNLENAKTVAQDHFPDDVDICRDLLATSQVLNNPMDSRKRLSLFCAFVMLFPAVPIVLTSVADYLSINVGWFLSRELTILTTLVSLIGVIGSIVIGADNYRMHRRIDSFWKGWRDDTPPLPPVNQSVPAGTQPQINLGLVSALDTTLENIERGASRPAVSEEPSETPVPEGAS